MKNNNWMKICSGILAVCLVMSLLLANESFGVRAKEDLMLPADWTAESNDPEVNNVETYSTEVYSAEAGSAEADRTEADSSDDNSLEAEPLDADELEMNDSEGFTDFYS